MKFALRYKQIELSFGLLPFLCCLSVFALCLRLGFWQLNRYHEKLAINHRMENHQTGDSLTLRDIPTAAKLTKKSAEKLQYRHLTVNGRFLNQKTFLLDNQINNGRVGYHIITPFIDALSQQAILVDRGFMPRGQTRLNIPAIKQLTDTYTLHLRLETLTPRGLLLGENIEYLGHHLPILQQPDFDFSQNQLNNPLKPMLGQLQSPSVDGWPLQWTTHQTMPPSRHFGYAIQWFALACALCFLSFKRSFRKSTHVNASPQ